MKTDIIIPVWNLYDLTKACIDSVFKNTLAPFRLIIIDNGSSQPTKEYLQNLASAHDNVTVLRNEENLGFVKAANRGIKLSSVPYLCLLNNDTEVTKGWLTEIIKIADAQDEVGIINANSNTLGCKPKLGQSIESLGEQLKEHTGRFTELAWATGFCMFIKHKVIEEIGLFDESYGMGNFEDADFCKRAIARGYLCVCALASYVYHRERQSFIKFKEFNQEFRRLRQTFYAKWGKMQRILYVLTENQPMHSQTIAQEALGFARKGNVIWIFTKDIQKLNIRHHSNLYVYSLPHTFFDLVSLWRILKRKKKFDKIYVDDQRYEKRLKRLKTFHKAEVIYAK